MPYTITPLLGEAKVYVSIVSVMISESNITAHWGHRVD